MTSNVSINTYNDILQNVLRMICTFSLFDCYKRF